MGLRLNPIDIVHPIRPELSAAKTRQHMNVILDTSNEDGRTIEFFGNLTQISVQGSANLLVPKKRPTVFGREDQ
ncbi:MAG: hypothetical protein O2960_24285 [Verrucomicrobia bacterium]|nr:hypothetical protein [Verrucomicrobiota bacterium]